MIRSAIFGLLIVIGSLQWVSSNAARLAFQGWRSLSTLVLDPGHASPVVVGCALIALCGAMMFRHVAVWSLAYVVILSVSIGAFAGAMTLITSANLMPPAERGATPNVVAPSAPPPIHWTAGDPRPSK